MPKNKGLILGSGSIDYPQYRKTDNIKIDINPDCGADIVHDLEDLPLPFKDKEFSVIYAFEVLEHVGRQGNWKGFFDEFAEYYRILKNLGLMIITIPSKENNCYLSEPGHTRVLEPITFNFLEQEFYKRNIGVTCSSDYRWYWKNNFNLVRYEKIGDNDRWFIVLQKYEK